MPPDDLSEFFAAIRDARDRAMFVLMLRCGLRIAEVAGLELTDLYLDEVHPRLVAHGKGSKERAVYLSPQAERTLRAYLIERLRVACNFLFLSYQERGLFTTAIHKRLMVYRARAHVQLTAHRLLHTFGRRLAQARVPVTTIQRLFGHARLRTTELYIHLSDPELQASYEAAMTETPALACGASVTRHLPLEGGVP